MFSKNSVRAEEHWRKRQVSQAITVIILLGLAALLDAQSSVSLRNDVCSVAFDPASLQVNIKDGDHPSIAVSVAQTNLGPVANLTTSATNASWSLPDEKISVSFTLTGHVLLAHIQADSPGEFTFPVIPESKFAKGWILPMFEGVYAPSHDPQWVSFLTNYGPMNTTADLGMPFLGLDFGDCTANYIFTNAFNNELAFHGFPGNSLEALFTHRFTRNHPVKEYGVLIQIGGGSPVEPARLYRKWIMDRGEFVTYKEKVQRTPDAEKLLGAAQIYIWGQDLLHHTDVKNWKQFCRALQEAGGAPAATPAKRVWSLLTPDAQKFVAQLLNEQWPDNYTKNQITDDLNRLLLRADFSGASETATKTMTQVEICRTNCQALASSFPGLFTAPETWGNGVSPKMIHQLAAAGLDRLWLGCDSWDGLINRPETVTAAKQAGYLIGPYDSFNSVHRTNEPNTWETAQFDETLYETGAVIKADGSKKRGFKKMGYILSPDAARPYVEQRVTRLMNQFHANSWFVDCDGFGDYLDDYSPQHPATQQSDMEARISRMAWIRDTFGAVIGTECCSAGVAGTVHFAHGVMTPVIGWGDKDLSDPKSKYFIGRYYPPDGPAVFFKPSVIKEEYRHIYFDPRFRLPLFENVFHDSVIATHHWSYGSFKTKDLARTVELLELLYNVPPLYHLNLEEFQKRKDQILHHYAFFSPLHRQLAELPMTDFRWLEADHAVQLTTFGDKIDLVANFSDKEFEFEKVVLPPQTILAKWRDGQKPILYTP